MKRFFIVFLVFLLSWLFISCSTVKHYTPNTENFNVDNSVNIPHDSINLIVNDLRGDNIDQTKNIIAHIVLSSLNNLQNNFNNENSIITIDIIEHRAFFTFMRWNAETILKLNISNENSIIIEQTINANDSIFNTGGYRSAERVAQKSFEKAMNDLMEIFNNTLF